ncbi:cysteine peptidase family C39 domain-containing protein [Carnobacterium maltaromaticum]|uniref:cysteine peptidase family C39 domain-containing protein n=1 Tax=Carnobacterium maltaromaticum TaxID=2751 RepID=UPI00295F074A|nr:cysteine peptidase family C39 domain-containing protein [Carnobacterium maltaromaticum]
MDTIYRKIYTPQIGKSDCGAAALTMISKYYGYNYSLSTITSLAKTNELGTTAFGIEEAAKKIGFKSKVIKADMHIFNMENLIYPFIVHVGNELSTMHYIVILEKNENNLVIADPNPEYNIYTITLQQFQNNWSQIVILFEFVEYEKKLLNPDF